MPSILYHQSILSFMNDYTLEARTQQLFACVYVHEHRDELLKLMEQQLIDDAYQTVTTDT